MTPFQQLAESGITATFPAPILAKISNFLKTGQILAAKTRQIHLKVERHRTAGDEDAKATPLDEIRNRRRQ
jgi:hypothetical protein